VHKNTCLLCYYECELADCQRKIELFIKLLYAFPLLAEDAKRKKGKFLVELAFLPPTQGQTQNDTALLARKPEKR